jgi:hypothetical protein
MDVHTLLIHTDMTAMRDTMTLYPRLSSPVVIYSYYLAQLARDLLCYVT